VRARPVHQRAAMVQRGGAHLARVDRRSSRDRADNVERQPPVRLAELFRQRRDSLKRGRCAESDGQRAPFVAVVSDSSCAATGPIRSDRNALQFRPRTIASSWASSATVRVRGSSSQ